MVDLEMSVQMNISNNFSPERPQIVRIETEAHPVPVLTPNRLSQHLADLSTLSSVEKRKTKENANVFSPTKKLKQSSSNVNRNNFETESNEFDDCDGITDDQLCDLVNPSRVNKSLFSTVNDYANDEEEDDYELSN